MLQKSYHVFQKKSIYPDKKRLFAHRRGRLAKIIPDFTKIMFVLPHRMWYIEEGWIRPKKAPFLRRRSGRTDRDRKRIPPSLSSKPARQFRAGFSLKRSGRSGQKRACFFAHITKNLAKIAFVFSLFLCYIEMGWVHPEKTWEKGYFV
ncbi:MAG: hypothetical protein IKI50_06995 [Clostridia bacterium]|nr:hypothetical protein [Clostridia bacterium]